MGYRGGPPLLLYAILADSARILYVPICDVWRRRPKGAAESRSGGRRGRQQQAGSGRQDGTAAASRARPYI